MLVGLLVGELRNSGWGVAVACPSGTQDKGELCMSESSYMTSLVGYIMQNKLIPVMLYALIRVKVHPIDFPLFDISWATLYVCQLQCWPGEEWFGMKRWWQNLQCTHCIAGMLQFTITCHCPVLAWCLRFPDYANNKLVLDECAKARMLLSHLHSHLVVSVGLVETLREPCSYVIALKLDGLTALAVGFWDGYSNVICNHVYWFNSLFYKILFVFTTDKL